MALSNASVDVGHWVLLVARLALLFSLIVLLIQSRRSTRKLMSKLDMISKAIVGEAQKRSSDEARREPAANDQDPSVKPRE